ncbi:MAG: tail fiber domain-containing protein, partial [Dolichospermum sp.]
IPNLPADKITSGTISGSLTVTNVLKIGQDAPGGTRGWMTRGISILSDTDNLFIGLKDEGSNRKDAVIAWGDDPQDDLRFINVPSRGAANGTEIMRLKPSGNVGIGTETPSEKLEVSGNLRVTGTITGNINATNINAGVLDAARIANNSLSSDKIISLSADKITSGTISGNLSVTGALNADSLVLGPTNASNLRLGYHQDYSWIQSHGNKPLLINTSNNVGIGSTVNPIARLDISSASRTGTHPTAVKGLYITGDFNGDSDGVEFRHSNGSQGIGFGFNTIYAAGSNANQDLSLKPKGTGQVTVSGNLKVTGSLTAGGSDIYFTQTDHTHTGFGNTEGFAAIENASNHNALMILGRQTSTGRIIKVWDRFEVNGTFVNNSSQEHKQDITKLSNEDLNSILERLKQTPVFRYRFKTPGIDGKIRLGVIAEQSPEDILDESGKAVSFLDYNGFLLAALKAQQSLIENLQNDILLLQKR